MAEKLSKAVAAVLKRAVSGGEIKDVMDSIPGDYGELFGEKPAGPLSPST